MISRKNEFEADNYAKETYNGDSLVLALKKLYVDSLSNIYPHPLYVFFHYLSNIIFLFRTIPVFVDN